MLKNILLSLLAFALISLAATDGHCREVVPFNTGWKFTKGNPVNAHQPDFPDGDWESVRLPHDWAIAGPFDPKGNADTGKLPWKGEGWYRKTFSLAPHQRGQRIYFLFDGIMAFPKVYINGKLAGEWDYGYNSFYLDATAFLQPQGDNVIAIHVDTREHDSRWYPGAGIYRKIQMIVLDPVHVDIWGTYVTTPAVNEQWADVRILTEVVNQGTQAETVLMESRLLSPEGRTIAADTLSRVIAPGGRHTFEQWFTLTRPRRWDVDHPVRYRVKTILRRNGTVCDTYTTPFGIRSIRFTPNDGFHLNGRRVQLKGVNLHHDHGPLGAKFYPRAMERQLLIMKEMGVNAIRNSHNVAAPELLELCDSLGLLVFNEAYDKWDGKADILPETDFREYAERNIRNFIRRDRNHPCVFIWSVGNEMADVQGNTNGGLRKLAIMTDLVRQYDRTRPLTIANDQPGNVKWRHFDYYDVHSWNYGRRYLPARQTEPNKPVIISESASTVSTRGFYELPLPAKKTDFTTSGQISSYDWNAPWWAEIPDDSFAWTEDDAYVCGEFVWTGFDYLGEPTPYNFLLLSENRISLEETAKSSYFGIVDLCGIPKDRFFLYKSYWRPEETTVHILPHWNWEGHEGRNIPVFVYTNGDCAELFLNGKSLGRRCKDPKSNNSAERYRLMWLDVPYEPGELEAVAYKEGDRIGEARRKTAGAPQSLKLTPDRILLRADGDDLCYLLVEAFDKAGNPCPLADDTVTFAVEGAGSLEAVGNGNPQSLQPFLANQRKLFFGKAMLIVRTKEGETGKIRISATAKGLDKAGVVIESW